MWRKAEETGREFETRLFWSTETEEEGNWETHSSQLAPLNTNITVSGMEERIEIEGVEQIVVQSVWIYIVVFFWILRLCGASNTHIHTLGKFEKNMWSVFRTRIGSKSSLLNSAPEHLCKVWKEEAGRKGNICVGWNIKFIVSPTWPEQRRAILSMLLVVVWVVCKKYGVFMMIIGLCHEMVLSWRTEEQKLWACYFAPVWSRFRVWSSWWLYYDADDYDIALPSHKFCKKTVEVRTSEVVEGMRRVGIAAE